MTRAGWLLATVAIGLCAICSGCKSGGARAEVDQGAPVGSAPAYDATGSPPAYDATLTDPVGPTGDSGEADPPSVEAAFEAATPPTDAGQASSPTATPELSPLALLVLGGGLPLGWLWRRRRARS